MKVERRLYRLRFLNASNARAYALELGNGRTMVQIGSDGGLLPAPVARTSIPLEPAERVDVIVDFRQFGVGSKVILHNTVGEPSTQRGDALRRRQGRRRGGADPEAAAPRTEELPEVNAERSWPLTFQGLAGGGSVWQIAGGGFSRDADRLPPAPGLDRAVDVGQPVLAHAPDAPARLPLPGRQRSNGKPPHPGDAGWKDTVAGLSATRPSSCGRTSTTSRASTSSTAMPPSTATCR